MPSLVFVHFNRACSLQCLEMTTKFMRIAIFLRSWANHLLPELNRIHSLPSFCKSSQLLGCQINACLHWDQLSCILFLHSHTMAVKHAAAWRWIIIIIIIIVNSTQCSVNTERLVRFLQVDFTFSKADYSVSHIGNNMGCCWAACCCPLQGMPTGVGVGVSEACYEFICRMV